MDLNSARSRAGELIKKYRYALIILLLGIGLMAIPDWGASEESPVRETKTELTDRMEDLEAILAQIDGVGKVKLMLTYDTGQITVYQTDQIEGSLRYETVIITDADRAQQGLVQQVQYPRFRGAVVVCQGAANPTVRLAVVEAVADATGLGTDRISVLKMK